MNSFSGLFELYGLYILFGFLLLLIVLFNGLGKLIGLGVLSYFIWWVPKNRIERLAIEVCSCVQPMVELMREMRENPDRSEAITRQLTEFQQTPCMKKLEAEGEALEAEFERGSEESKKMEEEFKEAVRKRCPDIAEDLGL